MSFRLRLTIAAAVAVAVAVAGVSAGVYVLVRSQLRGQVEDTLRARADLGERQPLTILRNTQTGKLTLREGRFGLGQRDVFSQAVMSNGQAAQPAGQVAFPVSSATLAVARGTRPAFFTDATVAGAHVRMLTVAASNGVALQLVRPLGDIDHLLGRLRTILIVLSLAGVGVAALIGALVARAALTPVRRLTRQTELVAETRDLTHRTEANGRDELSRLSASFNTMLGALEESQRAQQQLVADASHELRTPLTSVRTNIEVLARERQLPAATRQALLRDVVAQLEEMSTLVTDIVELGSERPPELTAAEIQLDVLVEEAVGRAGRLAPQVRFRTELEPCVVRGAPGRLDRAIANLLDNAVKWSPENGDIEVRVAHGEISVRDHGPGIAPDDLPYVFDRFYRSPSARALPGSGLGLAIVRQVVDDHGGSVEIELPEDGGTRIRVRLDEAEAAGPAAAVEPADAVPASP